jgi:hypothetical protein
MPSAKLVANRRKYTGQPETHGFVQCDARGIRQRIVSSSNEIGVDSTIGW